jgi:HK97 family phage prohead protease
MEHITLKAAVVAADAGEFEAVISTVAEDRDRDIVDPSGMVKALHRWTETGKRIPLAWNHSTKAEDIIGHIEPGSAMESGGEVMVTGWIDQGTEVGKHAWRLVKSGTLGFSYGFLPLAAKNREGGGKYISELDVFEITATPIPANAQTRVVAWKSAGHEDESEDESKLPVSDDDVQRAASEFVSSLMVHVTDNGEADNGEGKSIESRRARQDAKAKALIQEHMPLRTKVFEC